MVAHVLLYPLLMGLLNQTQVLSHVTKRVVESFGRGPAGHDDTPVVVVINQMPAYPYNPAPGTSPAPGLGPASRIDPADWLLVPPPARFMLLGDDPEETCVMGVVLDSVDDASPAISWTRVAWDTPVSLTLPDNSLAVLFAVVDGATQSMTMRQVDSFAPVDGHQVLALRDLAD
jgi:hypothetical protein